MGIFCGTRYDFYRYEGAAEKIFKKINFSHDKTKQLL